MSNKNCKPVHLIETVLSEGLTRESVDREAGVIRGVKVLGRISKNGREYSDKAMDDAVRIYEGLQINVDHPDRKTPKIERGFMEGFGELRGCKKQPDGVYADIHYLKSHPAAEPVCESAERFPKSFGLSHNAEGELTKRQGKMVVESLTSAVSVDIVRRPATNAGLFESIDSEDVPVKKISVTIKSLIESAKSSFKRYPKAKSLLEMEGGDSAMMTAPVDIAAPMDGVEPDGDTQIDDAFESLILGIIRGDGDVTKKLADIQSALELQASMVSGTAPSKPTGDKPVAESELVKELQAGQKTLMESLASMNKRFERDDLKTLLESAKREVTTERIDLLSSTAADKRKSLIESWPEVQQKSSVTKPRSSTILESVEAGTFHKDPNDFLRSIGAKPLAKV